MITVSNRALAIAVAFLGVLVKKCFNLEFSFEFIYQLNDISFQMFSFNLCVHKVQAFIQDYRFIYSKIDY